MLLLMGVYFGAFHYEHRPFLPMMMMGIVLSYVRMKTDNMFYSSLFHFVHNASTIVAKHCGKLPLYVLAGERSSRQRMRNRKRTSACI